MTGAKQIDQHILLEGDISIPVAEIAYSMETSRQMDDLLPDTEQFVVNTSGVVTFANVLNMNYFIDSSVPPIAGDWEGAIRTATQDWENLPNCRVSFNEVTSAGSADIVFYADNSSGLPSCARNLGSGTYAMAEFPGGGEIGSWISINDSDVSSTQANRVTVIRHEIGHALGFRHDNPIGNGEPVNATGSSICGNDVFGANQLVGTPTSDGSSVMVPFIGTSTSINFSSNDQQAATFLYPANYGYPAPEITTVQQYYAGGSFKDLRFTMATPTVRMYRYRIERLPPWSSTPVQTQEYTTTGNIFWLNDVPYGTWNFRITCLNYRRDASLSGLTKMVTVQ